MYEYGFWKRLFKFDEHFVVEGFHINTMSLILTYTHSVMMLWIPIWLLVVMERRKENTHTHNYTRKSRISKAFPNFPMFIYIINQLRKLFATAMCVSVCVIQRVVFYYYFLSIYSSISTSLTFYRGSIHILYIHT